ncbi:MAG: transcriptional regulator [Methyloligella sp.]|nr:MAG: transcriptional regulator [Methyloligella sp.]
MELRAENDQSTAKIGASQKKILQAMLRANAPLPVDHLTRMLEISRNATYQHIVALERDGYIEKAKTTQTKGRPSQTYRLTEKGNAIFPKNYALFSTLLVELVKNKLGTKELEKYLDELGASLANQFKPRVEGLKNDELITEISKILNELGYEAETAKEDIGKGLEIKAHNCVFHDLAKQHDEVCTLDLAILSNLMGGPVEHAECIVRGGSCCRFKKK